MLYRDLDKIKNIICTIIRVTGNPPIIGGGGVIKLAYKIIQKQGAETI